MHFNMVLPGLEEVRVLKAEEIGEAYHLHVEGPKRKQKCPACGNRTSRVHDYRLQRFNTWSSLKGLPTCFIVDGGTGATVGNDFPKIIGLYNGIKDIPLNGTKP